MGSTIAGIEIEWDVAIEMDDGIQLRADVFRPADDGQYPVILSYGPYGKWLAFQDGQAYQWERLIEKRPDAARGSTNQFQCWEAVDPEKWVPDGYVCVRIDSRGAGRSPGVMELQSPRETQDVYDCIVWAGTQPWSNGKVGMCGISYYASNQWAVAALQPPYLSALCIWEGMSDQYREKYYHGGIYSTFTDVWYNGRILPKQHGVGSRGYRSRFTGGWVAGPQTLTDEELAANRVDPPTSAITHPLFDDYWLQRLPDFDKIDVPLLSAGNIGGVGLHLRGNIEGFLAAGTADKWLELHGEQHWVHFYSDYGVSLQKRFFGHFLQGEDTGWNEQPRVALHVRHPDGRLEPRSENEWPLERTEWTKLYLEPESRQLVGDPPSAEASLSYDALGDGLTFLTAPLQEPMELTGPLAAKLFVSSQTEDADVFLVVRLFGPDLREVTFQGGHDPHTPVALGWLRASHRELDVDRSLPYRPYHTHRERQPLVAGEIYELDVEIWPTSIVAPAGYRLGLSVRGQDYLYPGSKPRRVGQQAGANVTTPEAGFTGVGPFRHNRAANRPADVYGGTVTLHWDTQRQPYLLTPVVP